jgi:hypothetical protein
LRFNALRRTLIARIFISYRREDSADVTGRIHDRLVEHFGESAVFMDVDDIPLGVDFSKYIDDKVGQCEVLLAVIGRDWLSAIDAEGNRRLEMPGDFVRIELESALKRNIPVVPLLVRRASMPKAQDLPESIREFSRRNGMPVRADPDFNTDIDRLIQGLQREMTGGTPLVSSRQHSAEKKPIWKRKALVASVLGITLVSLLLGVYIWRSQSPARIARINGFQASPEMIRDGASTTLRWKTTNAETVEILPMIGAVPTSGSKVVTPTENTTYTMIARGSEGKYAKHAVSVRVVQSHPVANIPLSRLSVTDDSIDLGKSTTLKWQTRYATQVEIQPGIGRVESNGSTIISPRSDTTYTLTAKSSAGTATSSTRVQVKRTLSPIDTNNTLLRIR